MFNKPLMTLALAAALWAAQPLVSATGVPAGGEAKAQATSFNFFDPNSWASAMTGVPGYPTAVPGMPGTPGMLNLATPGGWAAFMRPSHYAQFMNPATYAQFMTPQFYMQFANPNNWMSWMNPAAYAPFMNPATYMAMMNPAEYMMYMNPATYMQAMNPAAYAVYMNPATYMQWMNPAAYAVPGYGAGGQSFNWMDPNAWAKMMTPNPGQASGTGQTALFNPFDPSTWLPQPDQTAQGTEAKPAQ